MQRATPTDHFMLLFQTDKSPMGIGGLLLFDVPEDRKAQFAARIRDHFERYAPRSVVARRLVASPEFYDSNSWFQTSASVVREQIDTPRFEAELSPSELLSYVAARSMRHLDLERAPFEVVIFNQLAGPRCAIYFKVHHCLTDGIGFQSLLKELSDVGVAGLTGEASEVDEEVPTPERWTALAKAKFEEEAPLRAQQDARKAAALARLTEFMAKPDGQRHTAPEMAFGKAYSDQRLYRTISFDLASFRAVAKGLGGSINDLFLAVASGALRRYLDERGQLPSTPLVSHSVRSIRRPEHGAYGNRVLSIYPELATDEPDPIARLRRIQHSMSLEKQRSAIEEDLLDLLDWPYGARDRRAACANPELLNVALGSANVVLSNVPGEEYPLTFAGYQVTANYSAPVVGPFRFLNITSRRNADALDMGVMVDSAKIHDPDDLIAYLRQSYDELAKLAETAATA